MSSDEELESTPPDWDDAYSDEESTEDLSDTKGEVLDETLDNITNDELSQDKEDSIASSYDEVVMLMKNSMEMINNSSNVASSEPTSNSLAIKNLEENMNRDHFEKEIQKIIEISKATYEGFIDMPLNRWNKMKEKGTKRFCELYAAKFARNSFLSDESKEKIKAILKKTGLMRG